MTMTQPIVRLAWGYEAAGNRMYGIVLFGRYALLFTIIGAENAFGSDG